MDESRAVVRLSPLYDLEADTMTLQQQAYRMIDRLPDDSVQIVIQVMRRMLPVEKDAEKTPAMATDLNTPKMKAYLRMQELRKETAANIKDFKGVSKIPALTPQEFFELES